MYTFLYIDLQLHPNQISTRDLAGSYKFDYLKIAPDYLAMPDVPEPTGYSLTKNFHISKTNIVIKVLEMLKIKSDIKNIKASVPIPTISIWSAHCQCSILNNAPAITKDAPHPYKYGISHL